MILSSSKTREWLHSFAMSGMNANFEKLRSFLLFESCEMCGSILKINPVFCEPCWSHFKSFKSNQVRIANGLQVKSLFRWVPNQSDELSAFLHSLKSESDRRVWSWLALECAAHFSQFNPSKNSGEKQNLVLVPIPSSTGRAHSIFLANLLSELLGARVQHCLELREGGEQKRRSRRGRRSRQINSVDFTPAATDRIVLIDDIVTTGATAQAARAALGLASVEIWCLADRRRLAARALKC